MVPRVPRPLGWGTMDMSTEHVEGLPVSINTLLIVPWQIKNEYIIVEIFILGIVEFKKNIYFPKTGHHGQ